MRLGDAALLRALPYDHLVLLPQLLRLLELLDAVARLRRDHELAARERSLLKLLEHAEQVLYELLLPARGADVHTPVQRDALLE